MAQKFDVPKELSDKVLQLIQDVRTSGSIRKGANETTKSVERNEAKFVVLASDINPPEITMHLPLLCDEKKIPYVYVPAKADLGAAAGLPVGTASIAIANAGEAAKKMAQIVEQIDILSGKKVQKPKEETAPVASADEPKKRTRKPKATVEKKEESPK